MARRKGKRALARQNIDHPCFRDNLSEKEQGRFRQEVIALRRVPSALLQHGNTKPSVIRKLWRYGVSYKTIAYITGISVKEQRAWRKDGQKRHQSEAPLKIGQSCNTSGQTDNVRTRRKRGRQEQTLQHSEQVWQPKACGTFSPLQHVPPELLHIIMSRLPSKDIKTLRQTNKFMAQVGLEHIATEIPLVSRRASFRNLCDIAKHNEFSKCVRSLFYMCDRLNFDTWEFEQAWSGLNAIPDRPAYELESLRALFQGCCRLREVAVASETGCNRQLNAFWAASTAHELRSERALTGDILQSARY